MALKVDIYENRLEFPAPFQLRPLESSSVVVKCGNKKLKIWMNDSTIAQCEQQSPAEKQLKGTKRCLPASLQNRSRHPLSER